MEKKNKPQKLEDKIEALKLDIISNSKDASYAKKMLVRLTSLQKQADVEAVELIVPVKEVKKVVDFDSYCFKRTPRGILFQAKGGLSIFVENRMSAVHDMLNNIFELNENPPEDAQAKEYVESYVSACAYVCQALIFSSLGENMLYAIATNILQDFNQFVEDNAMNAPMKEETESDIQLNNMLSDASMAMEQAMESETDTNV